MGIIVKVNWEDYTWVMERVYIFDCDRIIGDEEKRTIIENMEGKAEVIFDFEHIYPFFYQR